MCRRYVDEIVAVDIPDGRLPGVLKPERVSAVDERQAIRRAVESPEVAADRGPEKSRILHEMRVPP
jgi:hypothetical protein